jgi:hypothetical protein
MRIGGETGRAQQIPRVMSEWIATGVRSLKPAGHERAADAPNERESRPSAAC